MTNRLPRFGTLCRLALLYVLLGACPALHAQEGVIRITGRVLGPADEPIAWAMVAARAIPSGDSRSAEADSAGRYSLVLPFSGTRFEISAMHAGYYPLTVELAPEAGEREIQYDLKLSSRVIELAPLQVRALPQANRPPAAGTPGGSDGERLSAFDGSIPLEPGSLTSIAGWKKGVLAVGGGGFSVGGQSPSQNRITVDGASFGAATLPAEALRSTGVVTNSYDPTLGQFSGGQIRATTLGGTNLFGGGFRARYGPGVLQMGSGAAQPNGAKGTLLELGTGIGGPIRRNQFFWFSALQLQHRTAPVLTLSNADEPLLTRLGIHPDSARRFAQVVRELSGSPGAPFSETSSTERGSGLFRLDYNLGSDHVITARLDARGARSQRLGESPFALPSGGSQMRELSGGGLLQWTAYFGESRNELRAYHAVDDHRIQPHTEGPLAEVRVGSTLLADGDASSTLLSFGSSPLGASRSERRFWEFSDEAVFTLGRGDDRLKVGFIANREQFSGRGAADPYGTFTFASLADLAEGHASSYTRTLGEYRSAATSDYAALFAGHLWHPLSALTLVYGLRAERRRYAGEQGSQPEVVPAERSISPRIGFEYSPRESHWGVNGGIGEFRGSLPAGVLAPALAGSRMTGGAYLTCVGPAAPAPEWRRYAENPEMVPATCANGAAEFASATPRSTVFAPEFGVPRTWRYSLGWGWSGTIPRLGILGFDVEALRVRGLSQSVAWESNIAAPVFTLETEGGRNIYAPAALIDPYTGGIAPDAARRDPTLGSVRQVASAGHSDMVEFSLDGRWMTRRGNSIRASYTYARLYDEVGMMLAPGAFAEPVAAATPSALARSVGDLDRRHTVQLQASRRLRPLRADLALAARLTSGAPYTPRVDADINGDGLANDAAFIFDPVSTRDPELSRGMAELLNRSSGATRRCLQQQLGSIAGRNSCRSPWSAQLDSQADFWPGQTRDGRRLTISVLATNVLTGFDRLINGSTGMRGWGQTPRSDATLLFVRGFDPDARAFRYEVNPRFGSPRRGGNPFSAPFTLTLQARWTIGTDPIQQPLLSVFSAVSAQGRTPDQLRSALALTIPNLPSQVLSVADTLQLALSPAQQARLNAEAGALGARLAPVVDSLAAALSAVERTRDSRVAETARSQVSSLSRQAQEILDASVEWLRGVLTTDQWNRLPAAIKQPAQQILPSHGGFVIRTGEVW